VRNIEMGRTERAEKRRQNREYNLGRRGRELKYELGISDNIQ
jgi:hypothetical protein